MPGRAWRRSWSGADGASVLASRRGRTTGDRRWRHQRDARLQGLRGRLLGRFGQLHRPGRLLAGIDLEIAGAVEAAGKAILDTADGELLVARAHESLSRPFAAAVIVDRVDIVIARDQRAAQQRLAGAGRQVPPALGGPALVFLVAERNPDPAAGIVAEPEIGGSRARLKRRRCRHEHGADKESKPA